MNQCNRPLRFSTALRQDMGRHYTVRELDQTLTIVDIRPQLWDRGKVYIAEDVRKTYQLFSHTVGGLKVAIESTAKQCVSTSSLFEAVHQKLIGDVTGGTFTVRCLPRADAVAYLNETHGAYEHRIASLINPTAVRSKSDIYQVTLKTPG